MQVEVSNPFSPKIKYNFAKKKENTERLEKGDERGKRILKYINPEFLTKEIVEELIDHIVVGKKSKETGEIPVEIHWNF